MTVRTRFAPSPTGFLHIGGARTALFNWLYARRHGGTFILRLEDTDEVRSTPESVQAILDSISWLELDWDEGPVEAKHVDADDMYRSKGDPKHAPYFQMRRHEKGIYKQYVDVLLGKGLAYRCFCAPEELDAMRRLAQLEKRPPRYDGRCRTLTEDQRRAAESAGKKSSIRFRMPDDGATVVDDHIRGRVSFENKLLQDFVIVKTSGVPTYNFACVIDDHLMEITDVVRGDEHLSNTPSQAQLYKALGWEPPRFAHLSMILGPDGSKLSKRHGATSVLEYRDQGYLPQTMRNYLALLGWSTSDSQQLFGREELAAKFDLAGCQKSPATFDPVKLNWMNGEYLRKLDVPELLRAAEGFLKPKGLWGDLQPPLEKTVGLEREKYKLLKDVPDLIDFFYRDVEFTPQAMDKVLKAAGVKDRLVALAGALAAHGEWTEKGLEERIRGFCAEKGLKTGDVFHPIRAACTGRTEGPTLFGMLEVMGRDRVVSRIKAAAARL